jgi:hypothetical protein
VPKNKTARTRFRARHIIEFPIPADDAETFPVVIDGRRLELRTVGEVILSPGYARRTMKLGPELGDAAVFEMFALAVEDDEQILRSLDYLTNEQWLELCKRWGEFAGAPLPE